MSLVLASNNRGKIAEILSLLPGLSIKTMREAGFTDDIPEPFETFRENALQKAATIYNWCKMPVIADDSGLCVRALNDAPGVYSARYAGPGASDADNNAKLLSVLKDVTERSAYYVAMICVVIGGQAHYFEGRCPGRIATEPAGNAGFGYDPLFIPAGYQHTFGELAPEIKKNISHRAKALLELQQSGLLAAL